MLFHKPAKILTVKTTKVKTKNKLTFEERSVFSARRT